MRQPNRMSFKMMPFVHETLYSLFRDPYKVLNAADLNQVKRYWKLVADLVSSPFLQQKS